MRVASALTENYGGQPTKPFNVARALDMSPTSGNFRMLCGASIAYGVTSGGYNAENIELTALGKRILKPIIDGDDVIAMREAALHPRVVNDFFSKYKNSPLPSNPAIAINVLESEMGVPAESSKKVYDLLIEIAKEYGFAKEIKGKLYIDIDIPQVVIPLDHAISEKIPDMSLQLNGGESSDITMPFGTNISSQESPPLVTNNKVFITHGKNKEIATQLRDLLVYGKFDPIISVDRDTVSKPVPEKVLDDMRSCSAAIIHVGPEKRFLDQAGKEQIVLNPNVLIEIGAAMALYQRRFVLLVEEGVTLPGNLQGLYEVRYKGGNLDYEATMKLLRTFNELKQ